jgi:hypothetical protein
LEKRNPAVIKSAFAAILGLVGEADETQDSLAHFIAWVSSKAQGKPTEGFLLDSLKATEATPIVELADWILRNQIPDGKTVLHRSSIIIIWKNFNNELK